VTALHAQDVIAGLAALGALGYLVRRRLRSKGAACEGCPSGGCVPAERSDARPGNGLITIEGPGGSAQEPGRAHGGAARTRR